MNSTDPIILYSPPPLVISTIIVDVSVVGIRLSRNSIFIKLTSLSHHHMSGTFSRVGSLSHPFR